MGADAFQREALASHAHGFHEAGGRVLQIAAGDHDEGTSLEEDEAVDMQED